MRELPATLGTLESVLLAALVLQVPVQIVVPVVGTLAVRTDVDALRAVRVRDRALLLALGLLFAALVMLGVVGIGRTLPRRPFALRSRCCSS